MAFPNLTLPYRYPRWLDGQELNFAGYTVRLTAMAQGSNFVSTARNTTATCACVLCTQSSGKEKLCGGKPSHKIFTGRSKPYCEIYTACIRIISGIGSCKMEHYLYHWVYRHAMWNDLDLRFPSFTPLFSGTSPEQVVSLFPRHMREW